MTPDQQARLPDARVGSGAHRESSRARTLEAFASRDATGGATWVGEAAERHLGFAALAA